MNNFLVTLNRLLHIDIRYKCKEAIILNQGQEAELCFIFID